MKEIKLVLLGSGGVGKTSIASALVQNLSLSELHESPSTRGIQVNNWIIQDNEKGEDAFKVNIWDFGGQEIYHSTHQFFLTERTLYLLVTDARRDDNEDEFYYWLNMVSLKASNSPVILVLNKIDGRYKDLPIETFKEYFNSIVGYNKISCLPEFRDTIESLKAEIKRTIYSNEKLFHTKTKTPVLWDNVKKAITSYKIQNKKFISHSEFQILCQLNKIVSKVNIDTISNYLHDSGSILHYSSDLELRRIIFLDFDWLLDSIYKVLDDRIIISNSGKFTDKDLMRVWTEGTSEDVQPELISLMKLFELCFELNRGEYLAPQLLPAEKPEFKWDYEIKEIFSFEIRYRFMPKGILSRFIVRRNRDVFQKKYWRYGVILEYEDTKALIVEHQLSNKIQIKIVGELKTELLSIIRKTFNDIHKTYRNIEIEEMVPCICSTCSGSRNPHFYSYKQLLRRLKHGKRVVECDISFELVPIESVLEGANLPSEKEILDALDSISISKLLGKTDSK